MIAHAADWSPTVVFECAGAAPAVELAIQAVAIGGRVVVVGLAGKPVPVVPLRFVRRGLTLTASLIYDHPDDFQRTIELVRLGRAQPSALVTHVRGLEDAPEAVQLVASGSTGKALVDVAGVLAAQQPGTGTAAPCARSRRSSQSRAHDELGNWRRWRAPDLRTFVTAIRVPCLVVAGEVVVVDI